MKYKKILTSLIAFLSISLMSAGAAYAKDMESCMVTNKNGENVVKSGKATIMVPKGQCDKIKAGDFSGMSKAEARKVKSKLDMHKMDKMKMDKMNKMDKMKMDKMDKMDNMNKMNKKMEGSR